MTAVKDRSPSRPATQQQEQQSSSSTTPRIIPFTSFSQTTTEEETALIIPSDQQQFLEEQQYTTTPPAVSTPKDNNHDEPSSSIWLWRSVVVVLCGLWASNFAAAKLVMAEPGVDSSLYAVARFGVAALALLPGSLQAMRQGLLTAETARGAALCGSWVSLGYLGQTLGLLTTTASRSCVICTLHCVFVAAVAEFLRVQKANNADVNMNTNSPFMDDNDNDETTTSFNFVRLLPAAVAVSGVALVELKGAGGAPTIGDALSFAQPIGFGLGYLQLENLMKQSPQAGLPISAIKLSMTALFSMILFQVLPYVDGSQVWADFAWRIPDFTPIIQSPMALGGILYTGLITTALALWVESIAFKRVPATDASIILTTEPLFAAAIGAWTLGETFGMSDYVGAAMIVGACALAVVMEEGGEEQAPDRPLSPE